MSARGISRYAPLAMSLAVTVALGFWLARAVDLRVLADLLRQARPAPLLWLAGLTVLTSALRAVRLHVVLQRGAGLPHTFHVSNIGILVNCLLPFRTGELCMALLLGPVLPGGRPEALSRIFIDRVLDAFAVLALFAVAQPLLIQARVQSGGSWQALLLGGAAIAVLLLAAWGLSSREALALRVVRRVAAFLRCEAAPWEKLAASLLCGLRNVLQRRVLLLGGGLSLVVWSLATLALLVGMGALFPPPGAACAMLAMSLAVLGLMVAPMPAGIATTHGAIVLALGIFGVDAEQALGYAILYHAVNTSVLLLLGLSGLWAMGISLGPLLRGIRAAQPNGLGGS